HALLAGDRVQPAAQAFGLGQPVDVLPGGDDDVAQRPGGLDAVAEQAVAVVVEARRVGVVDLGQRDDVAGPQRVRQPGAVVLRGPWHTGHGTPPSRDSVLSIVPPGELRRPAGALWGAGSGHQDAGMSPDRRDPRDGTAPSRGLLA